MNWQFFLSFVIVSLMLFTLGYTLFLYAKFKLTQNVKPVKVEKRKVRFGNA